jgi:hypothetical protein
MAKIDLETLQRTDHDTLIRIEANLNNLATDVKIMGDGLNARVADHELRMQKLETVVNQLNPIETLKEFRNLQQQVHDFYTTANVYRIIAGFVGGLFMFVATQLPTWWRDIFHK